MERVDRNNGEESNNVIDDCSTSDSTVHAGNLRRVPVSMRKLGLDVFFFASQSAYTQIIFPDSFLPNSFLLHPK